MSGKFNAHYKECLMAANGDLIVSFAVTGQDKALASKCLSETVTRLASGISGQKLLTVTLAEYKAKRSLDQNRLMWALLTKLAKAETGRDTEDIVWETYTDMLAEIGAKYFDSIIPEGDLEKLKAIVRAIKFMGDRKTEDGKPGKWYRCYLGSSHFDTAEMTNFIEAIFDRLALYGIYDSETEYWLKEYENAKSKRA